MTQGRRVLTQAEIEWQIEDICQALEAAVEEHATLVIDWASAENSYKRRRAQTLIGFANSSERMTVAERDARTDFHVADEWEAYKLLDARRESSREYLRSLHARLDALRTLAANVRAVT